MEMNTTTPKPTMTARKLNRGHLVIPKASRIDGNWINTKVNTISDASGEEKPFVRRGLEDAVSHGTEIQGDDQLDDDEQEEDLCPCHSDVAEVMVEEDKRRREPL